MPVSSDAFLACKASSIKEQVGAGHSEGSEDWLWSACHTVCSGSALVRAPWHLLQGELSAGPATSLPTWRTCCWLAAFPFPQ